MFYIYLNASQHKSVTWPNMITKKFSDPLQMSHFIAVRWSFDLELDGSISTAFIHSTPTPTTTPAYLLSKCNEKPFYVGAKMSMGCWFIAFLATFHYVKSRMKRMKWNSQESATLTFNNPHRFATLTASLNISTQDFNNDSTETYNGNQHIKTMFYSTKCGFLVFIAVSWIYEKYHFVSYKSHHDRNLPSIFVLCRTIFDFTYIVFDCYCSFSFEACFVYLTGSLIERFCYT